MLFRSAFTHISSLFRTAFLSIKALALGSASSSGRGRSKAVHRSSHKMVWDLFLLEPFDLQLGRMSVNSEGGRFRPGRCYLLSWRRVNDCKWFMRELGQTFVGLELLCLLDLYEMSFN